MLDSHEPTNQVHHGTGLVEVRSRPAIESLRPYLVLDTVGWNMSVPDVLRADRFIRDLGMPRSLAEVRVGPEHFDRIAAGAMRTPWVPRNPRKIDGPSQVREILMMAA